jgi:hypothetical protein
VTSRSSTARRARRCRRRASTTSRGCRRSSSASRCAETESRSSPSRSPASGVDPPAPAPAGHAARLSAMLLRVRKRPALLCTSRRRGDETCPLRTEGGTRRVQLVREGGGRAGGGRAEQVLRLGARRRMHGDGNGDGQGDGHGDEHGATPRAEESPRRKRVTPFRRFGTGARSLAPGTPLLCFPGHSSSLAVLSVSLARHPSISPPTNDEGPCPLQSASSPGSTPRPCRARQTRRSCASRLWRCRRPRMHTALMTRGWAPALLTYERRRLSKDLLRGIRNRNMIGFCHEG